MCPLEIKNLVTSMKRDRVSGLGGIQAAVYEKCRIIAGGSAVEFAREIFTHLFFIDVNNTLVILVSS